METQERELNVMRHIEMHFGRDAVFPEHTTAAGILFKTLKNHAAVCACAESCTGGLIAKEITDFPGSSRFFWGGFVVYSNQAKTAMLQIPPEVIQRYGAVSKEVVTMLALALLEKSGVDVVMAVSGIAGPGGATPDKPVGTVWIAAGTATDNLFTGRYQLSGTRSEVREKTATIAMLSAARLLEIEKTGVSNERLQGVQDCLDSFYDW